MITGFEAETRAGQILQATSRPRGTPVYDETTFTVQNNNKHPKVNPQTNLDSQNPPMMSYVHHKQKKNGNSECQVGSLKASIGESLKAQTCSGDELTVKMLTQGGVPLGLLDPYSCYPSLGTLGCFC